MTIELNHTIVWCRDQTVSSKFLSEMFGLPEPRKFAHFDVVEASNGVSLDFADHEEPIARQHYAFLVSEEEFDGVMARIEARGLAYWADPGKHQPGEINRRDGGRGVYFDDPDGHVLEALTRPYGSGDAA